MVYCIKSIVSEKMCTLKVVLLVSLVQYFAQNGKCSDTKLKYVQPQATGPNPEMLLKICDGTVSSFNFTNGFTEIPTFSPKDFTYQLKRHLIDQNGTMKLCQNGQAPEGSIEKSLLRKADFDQEFEASNFNTDTIIELLRLTHILYENGYLSVGNHTTQTAEYYSTDEFCIAAIDGEGIQTKVEFRTCPFSKDRPVLNKCCPLEMMLGTETCVAYNHTEKWDPQYMDAKTRKLLAIDKVKPVYKAPILPCDHLSQELWYSDDCQFEFHPVTDNTIAFVGPSRKWEFFHPSEHCLGSMYYEGKQRMVLIQCTAEDSNKSAGTNLVRDSYPYMITMYIGAFFYLLTTVVHLVTWRKQNIHGRTLCSCTASLFFMQCLLGTAHLMGILEFRRSTPICILNGIFAQYFMIAAFTWLLVVNFDLWKTFGSIRLEGGKTLKRFLIYSLVGWGFPLSISVVSISLEFCFQCPVSRVPVPDFGKYYCFVAPWAQGPFVYYILSVLNTIAFVLALLTLYKLYTFKKDTANLRSNRRSADKQNVLLFLKLSVVMGLTWAFETVSWAMTKENENQIGWIIIDLYNSLSAIFIFIIFVCKSATLSLLEQTVPALKGVTDSVSKLVSTFSREPSSVNTVSTKADEPKIIPSKSTDSQESTTVRYMKSKNKDYGSTNRAFD